MAGIQIEQLDLDSLRRIFPDKTDIGKVEERLESELEDATSRESIVDTLKNLNTDEFTTIGVEGRLDEFINKSDDVEPEDGSIDVTESDGTRYQITPTRGYISKDGNNVLVYQHPLTHNANEISETTDKKFSSEIEKNQWNNKVSQNQLDTSILSTKNDLSSMILTYVNSLQNRLNIVEAKLDIDTLETNRKELIDIINNSLDCICKNFTILGTGTTTLFAVNHNLNSRDIQVSVIDNTTNEIVYPQIDIANFNRINVIFADPVPVNQTYTVVVSGKKEMSTVYSEVNSLLDTILNKTSLVGDGLTKSFKVDHKLGTKDIFVSCIFSGGSTFCPAYPDITISDNDYIMVDFKKAPASGDMYNIYISKTPVLTNQYENPVLASVTTDPRCKGFNNVNYVCSRVVKSYNVSIDAGETSTILQHNNGTMFLQVGMYDKSNLEYTLFPDFQIIDPNHIKLTVKPADVARNFRVTLFSHETIIYQTLDDDNVAVSYVTLDKTSDTIYGIGTTSQLTALVIPEDASNRNVTWSSSDDSVVTVDNTGLVTVVSENGTAQITVTTVDGGYTSTCEIVTRPAIVPVERIDLNFNDYEFTSFDYTEALVATVVPADATFPDYTWSSSNEAVATVDANGVVTPIAQGTCVITATSTSDPSIKGTCNIRVHLIYVPVTDIYVNPLSASIYPEEYVKLDYHVLPNNATNKGVTLSSSNPEIARVNQTNKLVIGVDVGIATIRVEAADGSGVYKNVRVSVIEDPEPEPNP